MNTYCRLELVNGERGREENERGLGSPTRRDGRWHLSACGVSPDRMQSQEAAGLPGWASAAPLKDVDESTSGSMTQSQTNLGLPRGIYEIQGSELEHYTRSPSFSYLYIKYILFYLNSLRGLRDFAIPEPTTMFI